MHGQQFDDQPSSHCNGRGGAAAHLGPRPRWRRGRLARPRLWARAARRCDRRRNRKNRGGSGPAGMVKPRKVGPRVQSSCRLGGHGQARHDKKEKTPRDSKSTQRKEADLGVVKEKGQPLVQRTHAAVPPRRRRVPDELVLGPRHGVQIELGGILGSTTLRQKERKASTPQQMSSQWMIRSRSRWVN